VPTITEPQCKVCNSRHRGIIEELASQKFSPDKIYRYLLSLRDPKDVKIVQQEDIKPSSIRRHLQRHWDKKEEQQAATAAVNAKVKRARDEYERGVKITIDKTNALSFAIERVLAGIEEVETLEPVQKHKLTAAYMTQLGQLIDKLNKISDGQKQEGVIDTNFFRTEINTFAEIVLATIRQLDEQLGMDLRLEVMFTEAFKKQWELYQQRQDLIFAGQLPPNDGEKERNLNRFNDSNNMI
jgi:hypothetical protein